MLTDSVNMEHMKNAIIKKSFDCCGQSKESVPEQVICMKKGKLAEEAFEKVKEIWNAEPKSSKNDLFFKYL